MFKTEVKDTPDGNLEETEYLNPSLPQAQIRDDGIGNRTESMMKSFGRIQDYSAVENIDRNNDEQTEEYDSRYSDEDFAMLDREAQAAPKNCCAFARCRTESPRERKRRGDVVGLAESC